MSQLITESNPGRDITDRVLRFLAYFGIVYGLLNALAIGSMVRMLWRDWLRIITGGRLMAEGYRMVDLVFLPAALFILICSVGVIRGWRHARMGMFVWAVLMLGTHLSYFGFFIRTVGGIRPSMFWLAILDLPVRVMLISGFPLMVLVITSLHQSVRATGKLSAEGFRVISAGEDSSVQPSDQREELISAAYGQSFCRVFAGVACVIALLGLVEVALNILYGQPFWKAGNGNPHLVSVAILNQLKPLSNVLLLVGAIAMIFRHAAGPGLVFAWAVAFIALMIGTFVLYDVMYVWWVATKSQPEFQTWGEIGLSRAFHVLQESSLAVILFYLFRQPEIAAGDPAH